MEQMYLIKVDDPTDLVAVKDYCIANGVKIVSCSLAPGRGCGSCSSSLEFSDNLSSSNQGRSDGNHPPLYRRGAGPLFRVELCPPHFADRQSRWIRRL